MALGGDTVSEFDWNAAYPSMLPYGVVWLTPDWLTVPLDAGDFVVSPITGEARGTLEFPADASDGFLNRDLSREVVQDGNRTLTMIDPWTGDVVANLGTAALSLARPAWAPDGKLFAFTVESGERHQYEDIHVVDDQGVGGRLTDIAAQFTDFDMRMLEWSPNGQYIALWARTHPPSDVGVGERLDFFVFDVQNRTLIDFCLGRSARNSVWEEFGAFWAPDSSSVILPIFSDTPELIIDIATGEAREIPVGISVWAWGP